MQGCSNPTSRGMEPLLWLLQSCQTNSGCSDAPALYPVGWKLCSGSSRVTSLACPEPHPASSGHISSTDTPQRGSSCPWTISQQHTPGSGLSSQWLTEVPAGWDSLPWHLCPCLTHPLWPEPTQSTAAMRHCVAPASTRFIFQITNF